jgi:O-antigen ligase
MTPNLYTKTYWLNSVLVFLFFAVLMTVEKNFGVTSLLLLAASIYALPFNFHQLKIIPRHLPYWLLGASALLLMNLLLREPWDPERLNLIIFFICLIPIYYNLSNVGFSIQALRLGLYVAIIIGALVSNYEYSTLNNSRAGTALRPQLSGLVAVIFLCYFVARLSYLFKNLKHKPNLFEAALNVSAIIASFIIVNLSGSKSPVLALIVLVLFFSIYFKLYLKPRGIISILIVILSSAGFYTTQTDNPLIQRMSSAMQIIIQSDIGDYDDGSLGARVEIWKTGLNIFEHNPIFGVGFGEKTFAIKEAQLELNLQSTIFNYSTEMHSNYVDLLVLFGAVGLLMFFIFTGIVLITYFKNRSYIKQETLILFLAHILGFLIYGISEVFVGYVHGTALFFFPIVIFISYINFTKKTQLVNSINDALNV